MVSSNLLVLCIVMIAAITPSVLSYPFYVSSIPNGKSMGKSLGHGDLGQYTPFGRLFRENGKSWSGVCGLVWPGQASLTVGSVLGDPCCRWTSGNPDFVLSAPNLAGTVCGGGAANAGAFPAGASGAAPSAQASPAFRANAPMPAATAAAQQTSMLQKLIATLFK